MSTFGDALREVTRARRAQVATQQAAEKAAQRRRYRGPKQAPLRKVDALLRVPLLAPRSGTFRVMPRTERDDRLIPKAPRIYENPGRPAARGWQDIEARFTSLGYTIVDVPDGRVTLASPKGRAEMEAIATFNTVAPLIAAGRAGKPIRCAWCEADAVTFLAGYVEACEEHAT